MNWQLIDTAPEPPSVRTRTRKPAPMTPRQKELARRALGLPNREGVSISNFWAAEAGSSDLIEWRSMVTLGEAREAGQVAPGFIGFELTYEGADEMAGAFRQAPGCTSTTIFDRQENKQVITMFAGILR